MDNKDEWKELEKWKLEKELKEKLKYDMKIKEFNKDNYKNIDNFFKLCKLIIKLIIAFIVIIIIAVTPIGAGFINLVHNIIPINIDKEMEKKYNGESFAIAEDKTNIIEGLYIKSPIKDPNIKFSSLERKTYFKEDYSENRLKYYIDNCENTILIKKFRIEQSTYQLEGVQFLNYEVYVDINSYNDLNDAVTNAYSLILYLRSKDYNINNIIKITDNKKGYYKEIKCDEISSLEEEIYSAKYNYIKILEQLKQKEESNNIPQEDKINIWRPESLRINLNGEYFMDGNLNNIRVRYNEKKKYYIVSDIFELFLRNTKQIEIKDTFFFSNNIKNIKYRNEEYKIEKSSVPDNKEKNKVYVNGSLEDFLSIFEYEINYDYDNDTVYIKIH